jgi:hypothetical protein
MPPYICEQNWAECVNSHEINNDATADTQCMETEAVACGQFDPSTFHSDSGFG